MIKDKGFTLIELLVVIAVIGLLSTLSVVSLSTSRNKSKIIKAKSDLNVVYTAIKMLSSDTGEWPGHQEVDIVAIGPSSVNNEICGVDISGNHCGPRTLFAGSSGITQDDGIIPFFNWKGSYMPSVVLDPWGREYFFDTDYSLDSSNNPVGCSGGAGHAVVVIGSYGPDEMSNSCDDIIKIIVY